MTGPTPPTFVARFALSGASLGLALMLGACSPAAPTPDAKADGAGEAEPAEAVPELPEGERVPKIACDEAVFDFGGVTATGSVEHVFKIKNVGTADLEIEQVKRT